MSDLIERFKNHRVVDEFGFDRTSLKQEIINHIKQLEKEVEWLDDLREAGVDNWQGIEEAIRIKRERLENE